MYKFIRILLYHKLRETTRLPRVSVGRGNSCLHLQNCSGWYAPIPTLSLVSPALTLSANVPCWPILIAPRALQHSYLPSHCTSLSDPSSLFLISLRVLPTFLGSNAAADDTVPPRQPRYLRKASRPLLRNGSALRFRADGDRVEASSPTPPSAFSLWKPSGETCATRYRIRRRKLQGRSSIWLNPLRNFRGGRRPIFTQSSDQIARIRSAG